MTAVSKDISVQKMGLYPFPQMLDLPVAASTHIYAGTMVGVDASGNLVEMATSTSLKVVGRAAKEIDNSAGIAGALTCPVEPGIYLWANSGGDPIAAADRYTLCYAVDNDTVAKTSGGSTRSIAGVVIDVNSLGVFVMSLPGLLGMSVTAGGLSSLSKTVLESDLSGTTAQTIDFASALPTGAVIMALEVHLTTPFTGGGVSSLALDVGFVGTLDAYVDNLDILGSAAGYYSVGTDASVAPPPAAASGKTVRLTITPDGGTNMTALTAGSMTVKAFYSV